MNELLFRLGQHALQADNEQIAEQVGVDLLGPPAHVLLLKARDPLTNGSLDLSLRLHSGLGAVPKFGPARQLPARGQSVMLSNSKCPLIDYRTKKGIRLHFPGQGVGSW